MKKLFYGLISLLVLLAACGTAVPPTVPAQTETLVASVTPPSSKITLLPQTSPTLLYPSEGYGPSDFPANVNPLTGLQVTDPALLERRPLLIKVQNVERNARPQWGLSLTDLVFEYYTEEGGTRFAALFLGKDADIVGPIRSGRFIDSHLIRGYKAVFAFGSASEPEWDRYLNSEYADRLVIEGLNTPLTRYDPNGYNFLVVNTAALSYYATSKGISNGRQNLDGMSFKLEAPTAGQSGSQVFVRYSGSMYNRWDYDPATGKYLRFSDTADDFDRANEQYAQLTDRLTNQPIAFDNVVVLYAAHELYSPGIYDILFSGSGDGYAFRDGQAYQVSWHRNDTDVVSLTNLDETPFSFKPGTTWFEVVGVSSTIQQTPPSWRFTHQMP